MTKKQGDEQRETNRSSFAVRHDLDKMTSGELEAVAVHLLRNLLDTVEDYGYVDDAKTQLFFDVMKMKALAEQKEMLNAAMVRSLPHIYGRTI